MIKQILNWLHITYSDPGDQPHDRDEFLKRTQEIRSKQREVQRRIAAIDAVYDIGRINREHLEQVRKRDTDNHHRTG